MLSSRSLRAWRACLLPRQMSWPRKVVINANSFECWERRYSILFAHRRSASSLERSGARSRDAPLRGLEKGAAAKRLPRVCHCSLRYRRGPEARIAQPTIFSPQRGGPGGRSFATRSSLDRCSEVRTSRTARIASWRMSVRSTIARACASASSLARGRSTD